MPPTIGEGTFGYEYKSGNYIYSGKRKLKVYVVSGSEEAYKAANYWKEAVSIEAYK